MKQPGMVASARWQEWAGFALGFAGPAAAAANSLAVGACVTGLAASALQLDKEIGKLFG